MQTHSRRNFPRNQLEAPIQYLYSKPDRYFNSRIYNYSQGGMYFEPLNSLEPNSQINIIMPNYSSQTDGPETFQSYLAVIRWCQRLSDEQSARYGVGVEILARSHERSIHIETQKRQTCDLCGELMLMASVCRLDGSICLCPNCFHRMDEMPEGDIKSSIRRFLDGNVL
jgi:ribosomal protein L37AE/L43A